MTTTTPDYLVLHPRIQPLAIDSGEGCYLFDTQGRRFLDLFSGIGVNALGHNHPRIVAAIAAQSQRCIHTSNLYTHPYQATVARELCRMAAMDRALFTNSGTESTEAALKLARCYATPRDRKQFVALRGSFHGRTRGALGLTGQSSLRDPFGPYATEVKFVDPNNEAAVRAAVDQRTAAVILEPVLGEGGVYPLTAGFLQAAREATRCQGALLIADECQTGLGRTGDYFAFQSSAIQPDIVTVAKPLAAGIPLGAVLFTEEVNVSVPPGVHGTTQGGGPLACRVAVEFLDILDQLLPHIRAISDQLRAGLESMRSRRSVIREVRCRGLMIGIQLDRPGHDLVGRALQRGLVINCTQESVIRLLPPYILSSAQAEEGLNILDEVLAAA